MSDEEIKNLRDCQERINEWQKTQFPNTTLHGAGTHLMREIEEACEELADCFFLSSQCERLGGIPMGLPEYCWHVIKRLGHSPASVILAKLEKNKARKWPEKPDASGVYEANDDQNKAENKG